MRSKYRKFFSPALQGFGALLALTTGAFAQTTPSSPNFYSPVPITTSGYQSIVESVGVSTVTFNDNVYLAYQGSNNLVCVLRAGSGSVCPQQTQPTFPAVDGVPQATVWVTSTGQQTLYLAYAAKSSHQLVIAKSTDGISFTWTEPSGISVGVSPAIAYYNNALYVSYQENQQDHYLGLAKSTDGVNFTNQLSSVYKIGHAPGMIAFNGQVVIAAFCQCDSHYLDVYTTTGSLTPTFATEDTSKTLSNASQPSLAVDNSTLLAKPVLVLGYMQNGQRYFQTTASYDAIHWSTALRQTGLTNGWNGLGMAYQPNTGEIWAVYETQSAISGYPNSANSFVYSTTTTP